MNIFLIIILCVVVILLLVIVRYLFIIYYNTTHYFFQFESLNSDKLKALGWDVDYIKESNLKCSACNSSITSDMLYCPACKTNLEYDDVKANV